MQFTLNLTNKAGKKAEISNLQKMKNRCLMEFMSFPRETNKRSTLTSHSNSCISSDNFLFLIVSCLHALCLETEKCQDPQIHKILGERLGNLLGIISMTANLQIIVV